MTQADSTPVLGRSLEETPGSSRAFKSYPVPAYSPLVYAPVRKTSIKVQEEPLDLGLPNEDPKPTKDCATCADFMRQRAEARAAGDWSAVSDCNVRLAQHPHKVKGRG